MWPIMRFVTETWLEWAEFSPIMSAQTLVCVSVCCVCECVSAYVKFRVHPTVEKQLLSLFQALTWGDNG